MKVFQLSNIATYKNQLVSLLESCVDIDSSIGFIPPISTKQAEQYWLQVEATVKSNNQLLFIAVEGESIVGCVQLALADKENALHRAEIEKLMVNKSERGKGIAQKLMNELENTARNHGRSLLVLDTRRGDIASNLYRKLGYIEAGEIPQFAKSASGRLDATVYFYKQLL